MGDFRRHEGGWGGMGGRWVTVAVAVVSLVVGVVLAQERAPQPPRAAFTGSVEVPIVNVDVVVTSKDGENVGRLTVEDFTLLVDGQPVEITHFHAPPEPEPAPVTPIEEPVIAASPSPTPRPRPTPVSLEPSDEPLRLVVWVDHTNLDRQRLRNAIKLLGEFLEGPGNTEVPMMLLSYDGRLRVCQSLTRNKAVLRAGLECCGTAPRTRLDLAGEKAAIRRKINHAKVRQVNPNDPYRGIWESSVLDIYREIEQSFDELARDQTRESLASMRQVVGLISDLPGRKVVLMVTDGIDPRATATAFLMWRGAFALDAQFFITPQLRGAINRTAPRSMGYPKATLELRELVREANTRRVSFTAVSSLADRLAREHSSEFALMSSGEAMFAEMSEEIVLYHTTGLTGGRMVVIGPQLPEHLTEVVNERFSTYSLGFEPPPFEKPSYHRVEVTVNRERMKLRHREGYRDTGLEDRLEARTLSAAAIGAVTDPLGIQIEALGAQRRDDGTTVVELLIRVQISMLTLLPKGSQYEGTASLCLVTRDAEDHLTSAFREDFPVSVPRGMMAEAANREAGFRKAIAVRGDVATVAVGLRDAVSNHVSTRVVRLDLSSVGE